MACLLNEVQDLLRQSLVSDRKSCAQVSNSKETTQERKDLPADCSAILIGPVFQDLLLGMARLMLELLKVDEY